MNSDSIKPFIGLAFHPAHVCVVEMRENRIHAIASRELVQPFDLKTFQGSGEFINVQADIVIDLLKRAGCHGKEAGVVINTGMVLVKRIPIALGLDEDMLRDQIFWEAENFLISPLKDYVFEYQRLPFQTSGGNPFYLIILVRKNVVAGIRDIIKRADLNLKKIDVDVFSDIRTLLVNYDVSNDSKTVVVDIQRDFLSFYFVNQREYFLSHRISIQTGPGQKRSYTKSEIADILLKELRRLVFGHRLGQDIEDLDAVYVIGGEAVRDVAEVVSTNIQIPVEILNPFRRVKVSEVVSKSNDFISHPERFVASVGVTLKNVKVLSNFID